MKISGTQSPLFSALSLALSITFMCRADAIMSTRYGSPFSKSVYSAVYFFSTPNLSLHKKQIFNLDAYNLSSMSAI